MVRTSRRRNTEEEVAVIGDLRGSLYACEFFKFSVSARYCMQRSGRILTIPNIQVRS